MATAKKKDVFSVLDKIDANEYKRSKGKLSYLSWTDALTGVLRIYPDTTWEVHEFPMMQSVKEVHDTYGNDGDGTAIKMAEVYNVGVTANTDILVPFLRDQSGCYVKVTVTIQGLDRTEILPVLNHINKPIPNPNSFEINTSIKRCLAKCLALHGLGLYIYRGEDLPFEDEEPVKKPTKKPKVVEVKK
jgi:hypothetical protein